MNALQFGHVGYKTNLSFQAALKLLAPYSPRLAYNLIDPANSLFQGTTLTPVTAVTNPVGVVIDQTQGGLGNLGAELVVNGGFDDSSNWTLTNGGVISGGALVATALAAGSPIARNVGGVVAGRTYIVTFTVSDYSGGGFSAGVNAATQWGTARNTNGTYTEILTAPISGGVTIYTRLTNTTGKVDNISVREIPGNHATASSDAKRPLFARYPATGRRNLLTYSKTYTDSSWTKTGVTASAGGVITTTNATTSMYVRRTVSTVSGTQYTFSFWAKANGVSTMQIFGNVGGNFNSSVFNLTSEFQRFSVTRTATATGSSVIDLYLGSVGSITGDGVIGVILDNSQFEEGATATNDQVVVTSADITEAGVRDVYSALFDGSDDCLQVSGFDLSNTDEVTVIAGVRKLSDAARAVVVEHTTSLAAGSFNIEAPTSASPTYAFLARGTTLGGFVPSGFAAPITGHLSCAYDLSGANLATQIIPRINNALAQSGGFDTASGGNFANSTLNIGGRNNSATLPYNGYIHYLFICGAIVPDEILTRIYRGLGPRIGLTV